MLSVVGALVFIASLLLIPAWWESSRTGITIDQGAPVVHIPLGTFKFALYMEDTSGRTGRKTAKIYSSVYPLTPSMAMRQDSTGQIEFEYCRAEVWPFASPDKLMFFFDNCRNVTPQERDELTKVFVEGQQQLKGAGFKPENA